MPGSPVVGSRRDPCGCTSMLEAHISSLTPGNILGVLTWGDKLKDGPLKCDLFDTETTLSNARKVVHSVRSANPDFLGQAWPRPSQGDSEGRGGLVGSEWGLTGINKRAAIRCTAVYIFTRLGCGRGKNLLWLMGGVCVRSLLEP